MKSHDVLRFTALAILLVVVLYALAPQSATLLSLLVTALALGVAAAMWGLSDVVETLRSIRDNTKPPPE